ncbi:MAG: hypothetical protein OEQ29_08945 [Alphaproteobacteria bacterium]|nr:hypothetical protein [Alphaproteobacteria bacterium]
MLFNLLFAIVLIVFVLFLVAMFRPEWMRRAVELLIAAAAAVSVWEWNRLWEAILGIF